MIKKLSIYKFEFWVYYCWYPPIFTARPADLELKLSASPVKHKKNQRVLIIIITIEKNEKNEKILKVLTYIIIIKIFFP
jgi:hypothetical protein